MPRWSRGLALVAVVGCSADPVALMPVAAGPDPDARVSDADVPSIPDGADAGDAAPDDAGVPSDAGEPVCRVGAVITDGRLDDAQWSHAVIEGRSRGVRIGYVSRQATDRATGNLFRRVAMDVSGGEEIWVAHWHRDAVWRSVDHPRPCGVEVAAAVSDVEQVPSPRQAILTLVAEQDGRVYWTDRIFVNVEGWQAWSPPATTADFRPFDPPEGPPLALQAGAPPIRFGFAVGTSRPEGLGLTTDTYRVDDFYWSLSAAR